MKEPQKRVFRLTLSQFVACLLLIFTLSVSIIVFSVNLQSFPQRAVGELVADSGQSHWEVSQSNATPTTAPSEEQLIFDDVLTSIDDNEESTIASVMDDSRLSDREERVSEKEEEEQNEVGESTAVANEDGNNIRVDSNSDDIGPKDVIEVVESDDSDNTHSSDVTTDTTSSTYKNTETTNDNDSENDGDSEIAAISEVSSDHEREASEENHQDRSTNNRDKDRVSDEGYDTQNIPIEAKSIDIEEVELDKSPNLSESEEDVREGTETVATETTETLEEAITEQKEDKTTSPPLPVSEMNEAVKEGIKQNDDTGNTPTINITAPIQHTDDTTTNYSVSDSETASLLQATREPVSADNTVTMTDNVTTATTLPNTTVSSPPPSTTTTSTATTTSTSSAANEMERRKVEAKLKIVYSYLARQEYDKALQQLQVILKKYDQQHQPSSSPSKTRRSSASAPPLPSDLAVELLYLRAQLYHSHLQQSDLALRDYVSIFQRHTTENATVNYYLLTSLQHLLDAQRHHEALELFQQLLPILHIHSSATTLQTYLHLLLHTAHYQRCVTLLEEVEANQTSSKLLSTSVMLTYYIDCYSHLNDTSSKEKVEHYTLLQLQYNLTTPEAVGEMYSRQRQYIKALGYYQRALFALSSHLSAIDEQLEALPHSPASEEEEEAEPSGIGRRRGRGRGKLFNTVSTNKSKRQTLLAERRAVERQTGMLYRVMAMNHYLHLLGLLDTSSFENNATALLHLSTAFDYVQEAMRRGVYDKEIRLFLSQYDSLHRRLAGSDVLVNDSQSSDNVSIVVATAGVADDVESVVGSERVRESALRRSYYPRFNYSSELPDELYLATRYFPRGRWVIDARVTPSDSNSSPSSSTKSSGGGLMMNASSKLIDKLFQQHSSTDPFEEEASDNNSGMGGSSFEKRFESEKRKQGYEEEE